MNNKERFKIAIECLKDAKPLKEICVIYEVRKNDLKKHGLEDKIKFLEGCSRTNVYHFTESNKILDSYKLNCKNKNDDYCVHSNNYLFYDNIYVAFELRYIEKANVFALCNYYVECPKLGTAKVDFIGAYIITPDKHTKLYKVKSWEKVWKNINSRWDNYYRFLSVFHGPLNNSTASWKKTFGKLFQFTYSGATFYSYTIDWDVFISSIKKEEFRHKNTDEQKQIDKLLKLPLKEVTKEDLALRKGTEFGKRAFIEHVKDDMICIRFFQYNNFARKILETMRFYIDKKNTYFCQKNSLNQFIATSFDKEPDALQYFYVDKTVFDKSSSFEGTIIDYYKDIIESDIKMDATQILLNCIYCPPFEKFWKEDFKNIIYDFAETKGYPFDKYLYDYFGHINSSASNVRKILGINEYQLALIKQSCLNRKVYIQRNHRSIIRHAKEIIGAEMLPSLTNKQTDELFFMLNESYEKYFDYFPECFKLLREMYPLKTAFSVANDFIKLQKRFYDIDNCGRITGLYRDYLAMVKELGMANVYRPHFKGSRGIIKMHDEVVEIYNVKKTIIENKKFTKRIETWTKFEYTGSKFSVVAPTKAEDIANEGVKLHHCVKSYIGRVADGKTNIVFIRKNTDLEKPFFTVEITNDNTIQQVHGFDNRNADTEKGLTKFVKEWAEDKNLTLCNINKIR